jgi:hypothetical protein
MKEERMEEEIMLSQKASEMVSEIDVEMLRCIESKFSDLMLGHSEYQIEHFIIGQFLTPDRKHRQCLHELWARYGGLVSAWYTSSKIVLEIKKLEKDLEKASGIDKEEIELDLTNSKLKQMLGTHSLRETVREMKILYKLFEKLDKKRLFPDYEAAEPEYWTKKLRLKKKLEGEE